MDDIVLEPLSEEHLADVLRIERHSFPAPWTETMFRQEVEETWLSRSYIARVDSVVAGYIIAWFLRGEAHILNLAVARDFQRRGIGRLLLSHIIELAEKTDHHMATLEVRASNDPAKLLYVTMGFAPVGIRRRYYRDNDEDAIVMVRRLGEEKGHVSLAIIAGSGLGELSRIIELDSETAFAAIPGVGAATIAGHAGRIVSGAIDGRACQLVLGRKHFYEGDPRPIEHLIDYVASQGATTLLVTSAVGSLRRSLKTGELVVIRDIIDEQNSRARARGGNGPRSLEPLHVDSEATLLFEQSATEAHVAWHRGTMFCASGPLYETRAEVAFQQYAGADVAAMSGAPEVTIANRLGLPVVSVTVVTNPCTGIDSAIPSHEEVLEASGRASRGLARVVKQFIVKL